MLDQMRRYFQILGRQENPPRFLISRLLWRTRLCSLFRIRTEKYTLRFHPTALSATLWLDPQNRSKDEAFFRKYLRPGDKVIDVGGNIGQLALAAASIVGSLGRVYSIEAHPKTFGYLKSNLALNQYSNIEIFNVALGSMKSQVFFADLRDDDQNRVAEKDQGIPVEMVRLDDIATGDSIQLLKIDVEGYEKPVLEGGSRTLGRVKCVYFESYDRHFVRYGYTCRDLIMLLQSNGFRVLKSCSDEAVVAVSEDYVSVRNENLIAVRSIPEFLQRTGFQLATVPLLRQH